MRYLSADEAKKMLEQFLGIEKQEPRPMTPQQMQMMQQMQAQNPNLPPAQGAEGEISIVANPRQNTVIIRAPPDRVAAAMQFLKRVDMPSHSMVSLADIQTRLQVFRLASLDPQKLIEIVGEMNILEPTTRISVDKENNALIVSGSAADRFVVDSLVKRLDGSGRRFEVLPLRRLDPVEVAESIAFLMGQNKEEDEREKMRRNLIFGFYGGQQEPRREKDEFRVAANTRYRQVLLWANDQEMEEVRSLLIKLGELPPPGGSPRTMRIIDASATPETYEYLQRLQRQWNSVSPNPLELPGSESFKDPNRRPDPTDSESEGSDSQSNQEKQIEPTENSQPTEEQNGEEDGVILSDYEVLSGSQLTRAQETPFRQRNDSPEPAEPTDDPAAPSIDREASPENLPSIRSSRDFDRLFRPSETTRPDAASATDHPAPIRIEIDASGNLVLISPDTEALDRLENMMLQIAPPKRPYQVFHIEHASAFWMRLNLEDYFEDEDADDSDPLGLWILGMSGLGGGDNSPSGLGKGAKLRFIDDPDTNTLVVSGATTDQLQTIAELIELWDVPEPVNKRKTRFTKLVNISYGRAEQIAETIKDAYRDLLSSNDKAFAQGRPNGAGDGAGGGRNNSQAAKSRDGEGSGLQSESGQDGGGADFSFKGKLSLGVDRVGNTLLVSAEGEPLMDLVVDMIKQLDDAARPQGEVQVMELPGGISAQGLQNALRPLGIQAEVTPMGGAVRSGGQQAKGATTPNAVPSESGN